MSAREWQPGDVAEIRTRFGRTVVARRWKEGWLWLSSPTWTADNDVLTVDAIARPLVVIDPEDRKAVQRLWDTFSALCTHDLGLIGALRAALREFANPPDPKPDEPTGLGAVVEANFETEEGKGFGPAHWAKAGDGSWVCLTDGYARTATDWPFLTNVKVLREDIS